MSTNITVTISQAKELVMDVLKAQLVPFIQSSPGLGKSMLAKEIAIENNLELIDVRLSQMDPSELSGFPTKLGDKAGYLPMNTFPIEGDPLPEGKVGWLCHHKETEVLTKDFGFVKFSELDEGIEVAQYDMETGEIDYAIPEAYIKYHKKGYLLENTEGYMVNFCITEDHDLIVATKPRERSKCLKRYKRKPLETSISGDLILPLAGLNNTGTKNSLSTNEKLAIAFQADGSLSWENKESNQCSITFSFAKNRKIAQFRKDFPNAREMVFSSVPTQTCFRLSKIDKDTISKNLRDIFNPVEFTPKGAKEFLDYLSLWDGFQLGKGGKGYGSINKDNIDLVQELAILSGHRTSISYCPDDRKDTFSDYYKIHWYPKDYCTTQALKGIKKVSYDDLVYCLKMPKTTLITRYNNSVLISGNCLLDEMNSASLATQSAAYKLVLDRMVGMHRLHKRVAVMAAGNLSTDKAIVNRISTAMQSRLIHLEIVVDPKSWITWADANEVDHRIKSFINFKPEALFRFDPNHSDKTFPTPRTWEFLSKLIKNYESIPQNKLALLAGTVGEGMAREFFAFSKIYGELPTIESILRDPEHITLNNEPSIQYALTGLVSHHMSEANTDTLIKFIRRLAIDFQVICLRAAIARNPKIRDTNGIKDWIKINASELM